MLKRVFRPLLETWRWVRSGYRPPAPTFVKRRVLQRSAIADARWIETGTYLGETTAFLARRFPKVDTIEPMPELARSAQRRFQSSETVTVWEGCSEDLFAGILSESMEPVNVWLDGHFSGGATFVGDRDTPILSELEALSSFLSKGGSACVMVDDVRLFAKKHEELPGETTREGYPPLILLCSWAEEKDLNWEIDHDIFVARTTDTGQEVRFRN